MKVWLVGCFLLFLAVEFLRWAKGYILPLPIYVLAGALLSIASNASGRVGSFRAREEQQVATAIDNLETLPDPGETPIPLPANEKTSG
jgi:hypothetical protein